ncbi:MAG: cation-translocating P-type ATPase [Oscillospiraceae bacterium]|nr:cation-translocating P-type ATPase [Oscillospiraceae bacterium]
MDSFYQKSIEESLHELKSDANSGLTAAEAEIRLTQNGPNRLKSAPKKSMPRRILEQFKDFLVIILIIAAVISVAAGDGLKDAIIIMAILVINMVIGITQENKADNALKELRDMSSPKAKVKRDGHVEKIDCDQVVAGDIVILDAGDYIPADIRIIECMNLKVDESSLTGESMPVSKDSTAVLESDTGLGDRINLASMGTVVTYGRGTGVVYATGMDTEMGKIAAILGETPQAYTPLQDKLNAMAKTLGIICIVTCAAVFGIGFLYNFLGLGDHRDIIEMLMVSVSLAVAAVPEGVAIVATVILAVGVQKMVRANVIVKKLRAVETLGSTTVICSDKTGTLTRNKMTVVDAVGGSIPLMAQIAVLCNDSIISHETGDIIGDPTETAMLAYAAELDMDTDGLNLKHKRIGEIPFDSERKLMSTFNLTGDKVVMNTKGAPDTVIRRSNRIYTDGEVIPMTEETRAQLIAQNEQFAAQALRVLGFAYKECENGVVHDPENDLIYVGMMCLIDPPREGVEESVALCRKAGITVKMITGDHKITAGAIAQTLGIANPGDEALDGRELDSLSDEQLMEKVKTVNVFARVSPGHKVRIVTAIKENNHIVAMTGDGVNDAPSLKKADIGIAMGISGTDVSKEAADMILTDDNFVSIVGAVGQGRTIYQNIRKVTGYLLSCNIGEILIIFLAILFGLPVPLMATQLLFLNLLTDALPAFALGMEGKEPGIMARPPRDPREPVINRDMRGSVLFRAVFVCAGALGAFLCGLHLYDYTAAVSMCFFTLVMCELLIAYPSKGGGKLFANRLLNISTLLSSAILIAVMYIPLLNDWFATAPLSIPQLLIGSAFMLLPVIASELANRSKRQLSPR